MATVTNKEIAQHFKLLARLSAIHGEVAYKAQAYSNAARQLERYKGEVAGLSVEELKKIRGIGDAIAKKVRQLVETGTIEVLDNFLDQTPGGVLEMTQLKGVGPKKVKVLWQDLGIDNLNDLARACEEGQIAGQKGFGKKTEEKILASVKYVLKNKSKFLFVEAHQWAAEWLRFLSEQFEQITVTGALRRKCAVVERVEFLVGTTDPGEVRQAVSRITDLGSDGLEEQRVGERVTLTVPFEGGLPVDFHCCPPARFGYYLLQTTGNTEHAEAVEQKLDDPEPAGDEADLYEQIGCRYIPPELREGSDVLEQARQNKLPELVELDDIKGVIHAHTTYSDGAESLETMADYCREQGFEYIGVTDHSQSAFYAGGLKPEELEQQRVEIDRLNKKYDDFTIFKGIESDILPDGSLDYEDELLTQLDFVIASVHSGLNMPEGKATARLVKAIEHPATTMLGHPTGRLLLIREGYPIDHRAVIEACAAHNVAIEINANPKRLDLDWRWIPYALEQGVMISINPDAHSLKGIHDIQFGVHVARKGGLTKAKTLNTFSKDKLAAYFSDKK